MSPCTLSVTVSISHRQEKGDKVSLILVKSYINNQKAHYLYQSKSKWPHSSIHSVETLGPKETVIRPAVYKRGGSCKEKKKRKKGKTSVFYILYQRIVHRNWVSLELFLELQHFRNSLSINKNLIWLDNWTTV